MVAGIPERIYDLPELRDRIEVFHDRIHAGQVLADMLKPFDQKDAIVFGIPAGGVPVAAEIAKKVEALYCPNIRGGWRFAVADAYEMWSDVTEKEVLNIIQKLI